MKSKYTVRWTSVLKKLDEGALIITASNRQKDFLSNQFRYYKESQHINTWKQPNLLTEKQWKVQLFNNYQFHNPSSEPSMSLISEKESKLIWEQIISNEDNFLLDTRRTADRARKAVSSLADWDLLDKIENDDSFNWREETKRLKFWYQHIKEKCQESYWLEYYELNLWLRKNLSSIGALNVSKINVLLPKSIYFLGYQEFVPSLKHLFQEMNESGYHIEELQPENISSDCHRKEFVDPIDEITQTAQWAKQKWLDNPDSRIGIIMPNLNQNRAKVVQIFHQVFCASDILSNEDKVIQPFDISLGLSLSSYKLVDHALTLFNFITKEIEQEELLLWLQSIFFFAEEQQLHIIKLSEKIRKARLSKVSLNQLSYQSSTIENEPDGFKFILDELLSFDTSKKRLPSQWNFKVSMLLSNLNWCELQKQTSVEYQTKNAWQKQLDSISIYDHLTSKISWGHFLQLLKRNLSDTLFQPQTGDCSIQIMGIFEATYLTFDHLSVCSIDNKQWPGPARPNPFIPLELQRTHNMPNSTAERELAMSKTIFEIIRASAPEVIFSHCKGDADEIYSVSPIIESIPITNQHDKPPYQSPSERLYEKSVDLETIHDDRTTPLSEKVTSGGTKLLQDIAQCQFRAFAHHRLKAVEHDTPKDGIDALDKGNLVHKILESIWLHHLNKDQRHLQKLLSEERLLTTIQPVIKEILNSYQSKQLVPISKQVIRIEQKRLEKLIMEWLKIEASRPPFKVLQVEQSILADVDGHLLRLQIDRIDELSDKSLAIIDYKTGQVEVNDWFTERPNQPQLPLYSVVLKNQRGLVNKDHVISALLYGRVKNSECEFKGIAEDKNLLIGINKDFIDESRNEQKFTMEQQIEQWQTDLFKLMSEYSSGESKVNPKDENSCQYCDVSGICRIAEANEIELGSHS